MEIDPEAILELAKEVDSKNFERLAELFREMLEEEHSARHAARPRLAQKFADLVDKEMRVG